MGLVTAAHEEATVGPIAYRDVPLPGFAAEEGEGEEEGGHGDGEADGDDEEAC